jgi:hypothetical protein
LKTKIGNAGDSLGVLAECHGMSLLGLPEVVVAALVSAILALHFLG